MLRSALILSTGLLAALGFACVAVVPPPSPAPPPMVAAPPPLAAAAASAPLLMPSSATACDPRSFTTKVLYLNTAFTPGPTATPPTPGNGFPARSTYVSDLALAFCAASQEFRQQLSTLDQIYINAAPCTDPSSCFEASWGWSHQGGRYIALSAGLWTNPPLTYSQYETELTDSILPALSGVSYSNAQSCSQSGACQSVDNFPMALLAALAHEMGHIGYLTVVPYSSPANFCGGNFYTSWVTATVNPPPLWRDLLTPAARDNIRGASHKWPYIHKPPQPQIDSIDHPGSGDPPVGQSIFKLVANTTNNAGVIIPGAPWASPFAAISPDEEFVETYKFKVLTTAIIPLTSVTITVPDPSTGTANMANIVADYLNNGRPALAAKIGCIPTLLF